MATVRRTHGVKNLVEEILRTLRLPLSEDVIDEVFRGIEKNPQWHDRYLALCRDLGKDVVNQWAGLYIARATGREGKRQVKSSRSLIGSDSKLHTSGARPTPVNSNGDLYNKDETAWLDMMARLTAERRFDELDYEHLQEFLTDMARRDRQEVLSRLTTLLSHLLKWKQQPEHRSNSWVKTIEEQRLELRDLLESGTLRNHAQDVLAKAFERAVKLASIETSLSESTFPQTCPWSLEEVLEKDFRAEPV
jgi:hypothetical protein